MGGKSKTLILYYNPLASYYNWEFIRRREDYKNDYCEFTTANNNKSDLARKLSQQILDKYKVYPPGNPKMPIPHEVGDESIFSADNVPPMISRINKLKQKLPFEIDISQPKKYVLFKVERIYDNLAETQEARFHYKKYSTYLRVWDLRMEKLFKGKASGKFKNIARIVYPKETNIKIAKERVKKQYIKAYELIYGTKPPRMSKHTPLKEILYKTIPSKVDDISLNIDKNIIEERLTDIDKKIIALVRGRVS